MSGKMQNMSNIGKRRYCRVRSCPNFLGTSDKSVSFFRSPHSDQNRLEKWKQAVNIQGSAKFMLCILHFEEEDLIRGYNSVYLRKNAVPKPFSAPMQEILVTDDHLPENIEIMDIETINVESNHAELLCQSCIDLEKKLQASFATITLLEKRLSEANAKIRRLEDRIQGKDIKDDMIPHIKEEPIDQEEDNLDDELIEVIPIDESSSDVSLLHEYSFDAEKRDGVSDAGCQPLEGTKPHKKVIQIPVQSSSFAHASNTAANNILKSFAAFQCGKCGDAFEIPSELRQHMMIHRILKIPCELCSDIYTSQKQLSIHVKECHEPKKKAIKEIEKPKEKEKKKKIFQCFMCKAEFNVSYELHAHMKLHVRDQPCKVCKVLFTANELNSHLCGDGESIRCDYCTHEFTTTSKLLEHIESSHENKKFYGCEKCSTFYPMVTLRNLHMVSHAQDAPKQFVCKICFKAYTGKILLRNHIRNQHEQQRTLCDLCGKCFVSARNLKLHLDACHHGQAQFKCPYCPRKFSRSIGLKKHSNLHRNDKYVCEICGTELLSTLQYKAHMKIHQRTEKDRKFQCKLCDLKFFTSSELRKHRMVHTGVKLFSCQFCEQSYKYRGDLNKHLKIHLGDKIHECQKCQQRFKYPRELLKHGFEHYKEENEARGTTERKIN